MIMSYWELHFSEQHNSKKGSGFKEQIPGYCTDGYSMCMIRVTGELDCSSAYIRLREPGKSENKVERVEAKELHKTSFDGLLIKIAESEGLRVDVVVLDQERSRQYVLLYLFYSEE
ncbi:hypothetical protein BHE74_00034727 [Ensete ventricosum]|nr:hypothetical protein BHE74_00034727 [Ensete ventricosum]